ncbi:monocarboxylate transporter 12-like [Amphiura filiformis]|uniref:monocarboxylate transporter 12-like n=1 Tax=Amphiura filiformis TaxID=82378 RepID=UPI003B2283E2
MVSRLSYRSVVVGAGLASFICCFAASFVTQFWHLYIILAMLSIGMGFSYAVSYSCFISYFDQHLAFAYMISSASSGIGYLSMPPLMEFLISHYTWKGALQITSAILANICVCGVLLRPSPSNTMSTTRREKQSYIECKALSKSDSSVRTSCLMFLHDVTADFDLSLFRNVRFLFQGIIGGTFVGAMNTFGVYLIPYAIRIGISDSKASLLMLVYGVLIVATRISPIAWIVDEKIISAPTLAGIANLVLGSIMIVTPFVSIFVHLVAVCVVYGLSQGVAGCMVTIVIAATPGVKEKARGAIAWHIIAYGLGCLTSVFLAGFLYDITGTYQYSFVLCGVLIIIDGIILLCDPFLTRWQARLERHREEGLISKGKDGFTSLSSRRDVGIASV